MSPFAIALYALLLLQPLLLKNGLALEVNEEEDAGEGPVTLLRCCRNNQELGKLNGKEDVSCFNSTETFAPIVYSPSAGGAINIPASWTILENARPTCPASRPLLFVSTSKYNPFAIISNGDVFFTDSNTNVKAGEYCVGIKTLLICTPSKNESEQAAATMRPKLRMCCGSKAVYVKNACVESEEEEDQSLLLGSNNSNLTANMDIVSGFPGCPHGDNFTIISDVRDAELQTDASILINNQRIPADEFCIERIKDSETQHLSAKVFACLEHAAKGFLSFFSVTLSKTEARK